MLMRQDPAPPAPPGAASLQLARGARLLRPEEQVFEAMLEGWRVQQLARSLATSTAGKRATAVRAFTCHADAFPWVWTAQMLDEWLGELRGIRAVLADLAMGKMRSKIPDLAMALEGRFGDHHALMCRLHLDHIGHLVAMIAALDTQIEVMMLPFRAQRDLLTTIPGISPLAAAAVLSEIGADVTGYFPDAAHLASWAGLCPGNHESAGRRHSGRRRHGNLHLQPVLVEGAWSAVRHEGYLQALYHRHVMKWGGYRSSAAKKKAIVVVAHAILVIIWHVLATGTPYGELGADFFTRRLDPGRETRRLIAKLEALGHQVSLKPAASPHTTAAPEPAITGRVRCRAPGEGPFTYQAAIVPQRPAKGRGRAGICMLRSARYGHAHEPYVRLSSRPGSRRGDARVHEGAGHD